MSFATDIYQIMTADSSLNSALGGIYHEHLPHDADIQNDYAVFTYRKSEQFDVFGAKDTLGDYDIYVIVISQSPYSRETLSDSIRAYMNGATYGGIRDIRFEQENKSKELDENIYMNTLEFRAFYEN